MGSHRCNLRVRIKRNRTVLVLLAVFSAWGHADPTVRAECVDFGDYARQIGSLRSTNAPHDVIVRGNYVFTVEAQFRVSDISDPSAPRLIRTLNIEGNANDIALHDDYAYVGGDDGLHVIDISDPANAWYVTSIVLPHSVGDITAAGGYAYIASWESGIQVVDLTDPAAPIYVRTTATPGTPMGVASAGGYLYVADAESGLQIFGLGDPANPVPVASEASPKFAQYVEIEGVYAYVVDNEHHPGIPGIMDAILPELFVIDVSDPTLPFSVGRCTAQDVMYGVAVRDGHAFVSECGFGIRIFDASDPAAIHHAGNVICYFEGLSSTGTMRQLAIQGDLLVAGGSYGFHVVDISTPFSPPPMSRTELAGAAFDLVAANGTAFVACEGGLQAVDLHTPTNPHPIDLLATPGTAKAVARRGDFAFVADGNMGLRVVDVSDPYDLRDVGSVDTPGEALDVSLMGDLAFVAAADSGLQVIDASDPAQPRIIGSLAMPARAHGVASALGRAYVACGFSGLQIVDVANPTAPQIVGSVLSSQYAVAVELSCGYAYIANYVGAFDVVDVSNPVTPVVVGTIRTPGFIGGLAIAGNYAIVGDKTARYSRIAVIDITDPEAPRIVACADAAGPVRGIAVANGFVVVAGDSMGIQLVPAQCDDCNGNGVPDEIEIANHPSLDWNRDGLIDNCQQCRSLSGVAPARQVATRVVLHAAHPNPFNPRTTIAFDLLSQQSVSLHIYDVAGRLVDVLLDNEVAVEGRNEVDWRGRDSAGRTVPAGVYLYRLSTNGYSATERMVLVK